ncbi:MAG: NAD(P)H-dependent glycerol-3-phosphate dehydrogenase [Kiritimatiellia bacterium]|jgi:glycerol-3-phosphate dehydrogenase (NAD(P)+)|nr:NAD(P)H-dependent glycerol-3-phosphate dehydrogenase [Kiritimatiellia bacterium]MDP6631535.1 NAD(P)H-dependent glycerol-3-phosphate dehydrogenase [Kiritimatiellia bacterium]MDP6810595.1 NAD(P)H-dependent glycerol-3-phosphate dehydrogenase [Kiritimatiellia bacterium]MDP7022818.1 NAD(P)H-dependent glycerol-3-phosphate dehydrogenase [Kiritimatiellia bacterium]
MMGKRITVIGDGGWGTALALVLHGNGHDVTVWGPFKEIIDDISSSRENGHYLPGIPMPGDIAWTADREAAARECEIAVLAVPTRYFTPVLESFAGLFPADCRFVSVAKGLDQTSHERMSVVAKTILGADKVAALSGPSHAEEVARGVPTAVVMASDNHALSQELQQVFAASLFRVYSSDDVIGVEIGGALKNVIAIAVGMADGLGFGDNTRAALITRGLAEMTRLGIALGARPATFAGLSGMGDLIVTCTSQHSRNRGVGERIGRGEPVATIMDGFKQAVEGVWNCAAASELAAALCVDVPVAREVYDIVHQGKAPKDAVRALMERDLKSEGL